MALQKILKKSYIDKIHEEVKRGIGLERFLEDKFPVDEEMFLVIPNVQQPEDLLSQLDATKTGDYTSAVAIYNAYRKLTPIQATNAQFWESLALTDLFPYMQKRWNLKDSKNLLRDIDNHFFVSTHGIKRHGLSSLWWYVYLSLDEESEDEFNLTRILFKNYTLRVVRFGSSSIFQHKQAVIGVLKYLKHNEKRISSMENVANGLTSYFNKLGAIKQLSYMDWEFFYDEMDAHIEEFKLATTHYEKEDEEDFDFDEEG